MKSGKPGTVRNEHIASTKKDNLNGSGHDNDHRVAQTAYELYEKRGRVDGYDLDDWLKAEAHLSARRD